MLEMYPLKRFIDIPLLLNPQAHPSPLTTFSVVARSQSHLSAARLPQEHVASAAHGLARLVSPNLLLLFSPGKNYEELSDRHTKYRLWRGCSMCWGQQRLEKTL